MRKKRAVRKVLKLRQLRRAREMSQDALGKRVGLDKTTISMIESGDRKPAVDKALALAAEFGVSVEDAFSYVEVPA
jgi:DNA-binding XRE family transcriptional regulator